MRKPIKLIRHLKYQSYALAFFSTLLGGCAQSWGKFWELNSEASWSFATGIRNWPDTGVATCYNTTTTTACTGTGGTFPQQDGDYLTSPAARDSSLSFANSTYSSDSITLDTTTGLTWQTCSYGLSGPTCVIGSIVQADFDTAAILCGDLNAANGQKGFAGRKNWRLPIRAELESIQDLGGSVPLIEASRFPATLAGHYWTTTTRGGNGWFVDFADSTSISNNEVKSTANAVRCVSTGDT